MAVKFRKSVHIELLVVADSVREPRHRYASGRDRDPYCAGGKVSSRVLCLHCYCVGHGVRLVPNTLLFLVLDNKYASCGF